LAERSLRERHGKGEGVAGGAGFDKLNLPGSAVGGVQADDFSPLVGRRPTTSRMLFGHDRGMSSVLYSMLTAPGT